MTTREKFLPYCLPYLDEEEEKQVIDSIRSNWLSKGPKTAEFEKRFAELVGAKFAIGLNSCTAGLHLSLLALGVKPEDEVITTTMSFSATANTIIHVGATPVLVDIEPKTYCIDPNKIEEKITAKTKVIVPVDYGGQSCDLDAIKKIAKKHNLKVSEDAAHAVETKYKGKPIGALSDIASFSFYATKNLCTGEGGMVTTDNEEMADAIRVMHLHGMSRNAWNRFNKGGSWFYEVEYPGFKYNMTDIQAGLGLAQLDKLTLMQSLRTKYAGIYNKELSKIEGITTPQTADYSDHSWHLYVVRVNKDKTGVARNDFINALFEKNIGTSVHYIPIHMHPYYKKTYGYKEGDFPVAEACYNEFVSLPLYPGMKEEDVYYVIDSIKEIVNK